MFRPSHHPHPRVAPLRPSGYESGGRTAGRSRGNDDIGDSTNVPVVSRNKTPILLGLGKLHVTVRHGFHQTCRGPSRCE